MIRFYSDELGNIAITTDAADEREFMEAFSDLVLNLKGEDFHHLDMVTMPRLLSHMVDMCCKYRGYKNNVTEKRVLMSGQAITGKPFAEIDREGVRFNGQIESVE